MAIADSPIADRLQPAVLAGSGRMQVGDYEVESEIARGGMGVVYRARQAGLNRLVALKLLLAGQFADPGQVKRFRAEAAALARLDHPAIVPIHEVGEFEGRHFFSMRLIEGPSLAKAMPRFHLAASAGGQGLSDAARRLALRARQRELAGFIAEIARAVHYAHLRGVLHRDLKPGNVLLDAQGAPHVTDFGLARCMDTDAGVTGSGMVFGTPAYMPPEQTVDPHNVSVAADVYSLGAIAYEVLTGRPPFEAGSPVETVIQVREREPIRPGDLEPGIDRDLETVVLKCLEKDPAARYGTALELAEDLDRFVKDMPVLARPVSTSVRAWRWTRRHPLVSTLGAIAALLLVTVIVGGSAMILRIWEESRLKDEATARARRELRTALLAQAQAQRLRGDAIQREANLDSVAAAAGIEVIPEVVHEAVAQLARLDVSRAGSRRPLPGPGLSLTCRADFSEYYQILPNGAV
ncbi:MAG: protein kinase, partial [Verrucomicrobia bacterium]|nr:protein kinase [Verrucomicrobiota bacterium]